MSRAPADGRFLKKRILPVLASQRLITQQWLNPEPGSSLAKASHHERKHAMWVLQDKPSLEERWARVTDPNVDVRTMMEVGGEVGREIEAKRVAAKESAFRSGKVERKEREILLWKDRPAGFTTSLERKHLNTRRARRRTFKEELAAERLAEREEAERLAGSALKSASKQASKAAQEA